LFLFAIVSAGLADVGNVIQNPGFESPPVPGGAGSFATYNAGITFGGVWRVDAAAQSVVVVANDRYPFHHTNDGDQFVYLGNVWSVSTLAQDITTTLQKDQYYELSFQQSAFVNAFLDASYSGKVNVRLRPTAGGGPVFNQDFFVPAFSPWVGQTAVLSVPATGSYTLELRSFDNRPGIIDNVRLVPGADGIPNQIGTARRFHTATRLPNGEVLVAGGYNESGYLTSAELYDPATATWIATGSLSGARASHTATLLPNGKVLVAGGETTGGASLAGAELYDPSTGTWSPAGAMATTRSGHTATLLPNGNVLVASGVSGSGSSYAASAEIYDPATGAWSPTGALAQARRLFSATLLPNGKVLVVGGFNGSYLASAELYDPALGTWSSTGALATRRYGLTSTLLPNGKVLAAGGYYYDGTDRYLSSAELYDPSTGTWSATGSLTTARYLPTVTLLPSGRVLLAGGNGNGFFSLNSVELYNPATGTWSAGGTLGTTRMGHTATHLGNGYVLLASGYTFNGTFAPLITSEVFDSGGDARLQSLSVGGTVIGPVFNTSTLNYTATVPFSTASITVTPTALAPSATIEVNGVAVASGAASSPISLSVGTNSVSTTVTGADGVSTLTYSIQITRQTSLQSWRETYFGSPANSGNGADLFDYDYDSLVNLVEFAFGLNPTQPDSPQLPQPQRIGGNYVVSLTEPAGVSGITYGAEWSPDLAAGSWLPVTDTGGGGVHTFSVPIAGKTKLFMRLTISSL
jgi:N-acetylneuraminic acid mutarotase